VGSVVVSTRGSKQSRAAPPWMPSPGDGRRSGRSIAPSVDDPAPSSLRLLLLPPSLSSSIAPSPAAAPLLPNANVPPPPAAAAAAPGAPRGPAARPPRAWWPAAPPRATSVMTASSLGPSVGPLPLPPPGEAPTAVGAGPRAAPSAAGKGGVAPGPRLPSELEWPTNSACGFEGGGRVGGEGGRGAREVSESEEGRLGGRYFGGRFLGLLFPPATTPCPAPARPRRLLRSMVKGLVDPAGAVPGAWGAKSMTCQRVA
jgi:hypothetical protein